VRDNRNDLDRQRLLGQTRRAQDRPARRVVYELAVDLVQQQPLVHVRQEYLQADHAFVTSPGRLQRRLQMSECGAILLFVRVAGNHPIEPG
jgi:hypothetical protein